MTELTSTLLELFLGCLVIFLLVCFGSIGLEILVETVGRYGG